MQEKHATVDGKRIRYLEEGDSDRSIVLLHGLGGMAERWLPVIPLFSSKYRVIAPDLPGFGLSDKPQIDYTQDLFKKVALGLLESLDLEGVSLVGTSLGGEIVAECAAEQSPLIKNAVMVCPAGTMKKSTPALDAYIMAALYPNHESVRLAYQMMAGKGVEVSEAAVENFIVNMTRSNTKMAFLSTLLGMKNSPPITGKLGMIKVPVLLIWGSEDKMIPFEHSNDFVSSIPQCKFVVMKGCGHAPYEDRPAEFSRHVMEFLSH